MRNSALVIGSLGQYPSSKPTKNDVRAEFLPKPRGVTSVFQTAHRIIAETHSFSVKRLNEMDSQRAYFVAQQLPLGTRVAQVVGITSASYLAGTSSDYNIFNAAILYSLGNN